MKKITTCFLTVACIVLLSVLSPTKALAAWNEFSISDCWVKWESDRQCYYISIPYYCDEGYDDLIDYMYVYATGSSGKKHKIMYFESYTQDTEPYYADVISYFGEVRAVDLDAGQTEKGRQEEWEHVREDKTRFWWANGYAIARLRWFPPRELMDQMLTFDFEGYLKDTNGHREWQTKSTNISNEISQNEISIGNIKWCKDGGLEFDITNMQHAGYWTKIIPQYSVDGRNWVNMPEFTVTDNDQDIWNNHSLANRKLKISYNNLKSLINNDVNKWKSGIKIRIYNETSGHYYTYKGTGWGNRFDELLRKSYSRVYTSPGISAINQTKVVQDNRNIILNWNITPPNNRSGEYLGNFYIDRWNETSKKWDRYSTLPVKSGKNDYSCTFKIGEELNNKGIITYLFRISRDIFTLGVWETFVTNQVVKGNKINTNYKQLTFDGIEGVLNEDGQMGSTALVKWKFCNDALNSQAIWDQNAQMRLEVKQSNIEDTPEVYELEYNSSKCTISHLVGCTTYDIKLIVTTPVGKSGTKIDTVEYFVDPATKQKYKSPRFGAREIVNLKVSKGYFNDRVNISWDVPKDANDFTNFVVIRKSLETDVTSIVTQMEHSKLSHYDIVDRDMNVGELYEYAVEGYSLCEHLPTIGDRKADYGFSQPYASVSGRVSYEGDQGVKGVTVAVQGGEESSNCAVELPGDDNNSYIKLPSKAFDTSSKKHTVQMWVKANEKKSAYLMSTPDSLLNIFLNSENKIGVVYHKQTVVSGASLNVGRWMNLSLTTTMSNGTGEIKLYLDGELVDSLTVNSTKLSTFDETGNIFIGNSQDKLHPFNGYVDEIRFWNDKQTAYQIHNNNSAFISGKEKGLTAYYRCDEYRVQKVFDISGHKGKFNMNDGDLGSTTVVHTVHNVPTTNQLANKAVTDNSGNYLISTVPYTSEGVQYTLEPIFGVHKFNPGNRPVFVSPSATVFNDINFTDVSSFEVKGKVYYENTDYPVEDCNIYVDGQMCFKDGEPVKTNSNGEYIVSVPIGDHFLEVRKQGHTFVNKGRYPIDNKGAGLRHTFESPISGLDFVDNTKVVVAGRVTGGEIEYSKPLGLNQSKANIGQAEIVLIPVKENCKLNVERIQNGLVTDVNNGSKDLVYEPATNRVNSVVKVGSGDADKVKEITIKTDSLTGEFAAWMLPIKYKVVSINIPKNQDIVFDLGSIQAIDATNVMATNTDSVVVTTGKGNKEVKNSEKFTYNTSLKVKYLVDVTFNVKPNKDGAFGDKWFDYYAPGKKEAEKVELYTVENGKVNYKFNYPVYTMMKTYDMPIEAYETYVNKDAAVAVIDTVPQVGLIVDIVNQFGVGQKVILEKGDNRGKFLDDSDMNVNQVKLDSTGCGLYRFKVGFPNINGDHTLGLSMSYDIEGRTYNWSENGKFKGLVLGSLTSGSNFVTSGPDKVLMILRDPPGSNSYSYVDKGYSLTSSSTFGSTMSTDLTETTTLELGASVTTYAGTSFFGVITEMSNECSLGSGISLQSEITDSYTTETTCSFSETVSTSESPDFVGSSGDVYIGCATNMLFGNASSVSIRKEETTQEFVVNVKDQVTADVEYGTGFKYTQYYIENVLIPNLENMRNSLLSTVSSSEYSSYTNNTDKPIYITTLTSEDERFGSDNSNKDVWQEEAVKLGKLEGPSYKMVLPESNKNGQFEDKVVWYNSQISLWKQTIANNEKAKLTLKKTNYNKFPFNLFPKDRLFKNHSFDAGVTIESTVETSNINTEDHSTTFNEVISGFADTGTLFSGVGITVNISGEIGLGLEDSESFSKENTKTIGYVLSDDGYNDALSVDVISDLSGHGPVFITKGGQTSCPYEGLDTTKYYNPGSILSPATMQIEKPQIFVDNPTAVNIPSGEVATYTVKLQNNSETKDDVWFDISIDDQTNPKGAKLTMDGAGINAVGRAILVPAGQTLVKSIQLKQTNLGVLDYDSIKIQLKSQCQGDPTGNVDPILSEVYVSAQFVPTCSNINISIEKKIINARTGSTLPITVKDYNTAFPNFEGFMIQYMKEEDSEWRLLKKYVMNNESGERDVEVIDPSQAKVVYNFDMKDNSDGKYKFRAITMCRFGSEIINNESDIIEVVKDVERPMPLGKPSPSNGILTEGGEISVTFNENIKFTNLTDYNLVVRGKLNGHTIDHGTAIKLQGGSEGASTEATIDLSNRSFAFEAWLNYSSEGEILSHGSADTKFVTSVDALGHLVVEIAGHKYISQTTMPKDKWMFLSVMYDNEMKSLYAYAAHDAETIRLFTGDAVTAYNGKGRLTIGRNMTGAMHELTLWNYARTFAEGQAKMHIAKSASDQNIVGYWKMEEGHGTVALDAARGRHLSVGANSWYIAEKNKAAELDGRSYVEINTETCVGSEKEDFMIEMWFRAEPNQDGIATIFSNGQNFGMQLNEGKLEMLGKNGVIQLGNKKYSDNEWHHIAVNVLRKGNAIVYADGEVIKQVAMVNMGRVASDKYLFGAEIFHPEGQPNTWNTRNMMKGAVDEIRMWNASVSADYIRNNRFNRIEGTESGVAAYYPFEKQTLDEGGQVKTVEDFTDHSSNKSGEAVHANVTVSDNTPSVKGVPSLTNVEADFVASERKIVININENPDIIEGTTLSFTLREVRDMSDNLAQDIKWTAYVKCNLLNWEEKELNVVKEEGKLLELKRAIVNKSGEYENWTIVNMPQWLTCDIEDGSLAPQSREELTFRVSESMPVGTYEETIYLVGNNEVYEPMVVSVSVTGTSPDWNVNLEGYECSMGVFGQLKIKNVFSENENDLIGAFIGNDCVGLASPEYNERYDAYFVSMTIYSNRDQRDELVRFKVWEASTGNVYPVVETSREIRVANDALIGSTVEPIIWNASDKLEQSVDLKNGWTWMSTYIIPQNNSIDSVFKEVTPLVNQVKNKNSFASAIDGNWEGSLKRIEVGSMYKVHTSASAYLNLVGKSVNPSESPITIKPNWNWIGCNTSFVMPLIDAFADLNPIDGDFVKSHSEFAFYDNYEWVGSLKNITPGVGYVYKSASDVDRTFRYPTESSMRKGAPMLRAPEETALPTYEIVENNMYSGNMTMVALVMNGQEKLYDAEVGVFAGEECRGAAVLETNGKAYVTIAGNSDKEVMTIKVKTNNIEKEISEKIIYQEDDILGTICEPYIIQLSDIATGIDGIGTNDVVTAKDGKIVVEGASEGYRVFNAAGKLVYSGTEHEVAVPKGVYMVQVGETTHKVVL